MDTDDVPVHPLPVLGHALRHRPFCREDGWHRLILFHHAGAAGRECSVGVARLNWNDNFLSFFRLLADLSILVSDLLGLLG